MIIKNKTIFIISPESWGISFVSKHHYASLLSENNNVFFFNPPTNKYSLTAINSHLTIVDYTIPKGLNRLLQGIRFFTQNFLAKRLMKKLSLPTPDFVWSFDPYVFQNLSVFNSKAVKIYHPVDVHYTNLEFDVVKSADVVFSTAHLILDKFKTIDKPEYFINHGLASHFIQSDNSFDEFSFITDDKATKVGYVGNLRYQHLDYDQLFITIEAHVDCHFYFMGPYEKSNLDSTTNKFENEISRLKAYRNVYLIGAKPSKEVPSFLSKMDLLWMCYKGTDMPAEMANPHKILEYLSTGKPIVTHFIDEYKDKRELLEMVDESSDFEEKFKEVINNLDDFNSFERQQRRIEFAKNNSYSKQLDKIEQIIISHI